MIYEGMKVSHLSETKLVESMNRLVGDDRRTTARMLAVMGELDHRRTWAKHGYSSMFKLCTEAFHMSEGAACRRIAAARAARRFPLIFPMVADGELHLSAVQLLVPLLTEDNHREVLARAKHQSKQQVQVLVAELAPKPDVPARIRQLPARRPAAPPPAEVGSHGEGACAAVSAVVSAAPAVASLSVSAAPAVDSSRARAALVPLSPQRFKVQLTVSQETHDKIRSLQALLSHQVPNGDLSETVLGSVRHLYAVILHVHRPRSTRDLPRACSGKLDLAQFN